MITRRTFQCSPQRNTSLESFCLVYEGAVGCFYWEEVSQCRSGKSSIQKVVFHKMSPNETLFLESTSKIVKSGTKEREGEFDGVLNLC